MLQDEQRFGRTADVANEVKNYLVNNFVRLEETIFVLMRKGLRRQNWKEQRRKISRTISVTNRKYLAKRGTKAVVPVTVKRLSVGLK